MTEWKIYRLGDILNFRRGHDLPKINMVNGEIPVAGSNGIIGYHNVSTPIEPCITIGRSGNVGTPYIYNKCWAHNTVLYVDNFKGNDPLYLYYLLKTIPLASYGGGSAVPTLNRNHIHPIEIKHTPSLEEQRRIAGILGAIDDKIENNRRINANLELQAQALYKQWFVDCSIVKLGDVVKTTSGGTPSRNHMEFYAGKYGWVKSKELNGSFITNTEESITDDAIAKSAAKLLPAKSILIAMYGATVGQYAVLSHPMTCNQAVCALLPNENYPYTYLFMAAKNIKEELANKAIGSAQQNISQVIIKDIDLSSDIEKIKQFHKIVCPHFEVMEKNQKENETLATLRDTLLPKLMSGELIL
jgi:type I restriction enzyme S subunit